MANAGDGSRVNDVSVRKLLQTPPPFDPIADAALRYLARRSRTMAHMSAYLARIGASPAKTRSLIARFRKLGYLNDRQYAQRWARDRMARKPMGRERLMSELQAQGLDEEIVSETLNTIFQEYNEYDLVAALSNKKTIRPAFLRSRGFAEDVIASFCKRDD